MIIKYDKEIMDKFPHLFDVEKDKTFTKIVRYMIDSKYRKIVNLVDWIKPQIENPSERVKQFCDSIPTYDDYDKQVKVIRDTVRDSILYTRDSIQWDMVEYWATADEILQTRRDDCDGFAVLIYALARMKGVPANRLLIVAGWVRSGVSKEGHAYVIYKPNQYPLNWVILDGCYWPNTLTVNNMNKLYIQGNTIREYTNDGQEIDSNYKDIWFLFNEGQSYTKLREKIING